MNTRIILNSLKKNVRKRTINQNYWIYITYDTETQKTVEIKLSTVQATIKLFAQNVVPITNNRSR